MRYGECHFGDMPKSRHAKIPKWLKAEMQNGDKEKSRRANMSNKKCRQTKMAKAKWRQEKSRHANMSNAKWRHTKMTNANLRHAKGEKTDDRIAKLQDVSIAVPCVAFNLIYETMCDHSVINIHCINIVLLLAPFDDNRH